MPLFHRLGLPDDCTQLFDENPDPTIYTEVLDPAPVVPVAAPEPTPAAPAQPEAVA